MATEQRRVIWRHPKGIYETVEVSGTGVFGVPYSYRETVYTQDRDARGVVTKSLLRQCSSLSSCPSAWRSRTKRSRKSANCMQSRCQSHSWHRVCTAHRRLCERYSQRTM